MFEGTNSIPANQLVIDDRLLKLQSLQKYSIFSGILLLIIHLSFLLYSFLEIDDFYAMIIFPIALIVTVSKSICGSLTRILQFISIGVYLTLIVTILYLVSMAYWFTFEYSIFMWTAIVFGFIHCAITFSFLIKLRRLTIAEYQQSRTYLCNCKFSYSEIKTETFFICMIFVLKYTNISLCLHSAFVLFSLHIASYLNSCSISNPEIYMEKARKRNIIVILIMLIACWIPIPMAGSYHILYGVFMAVAVCLPVYIALAISLNGVYSRSLSAMVAGFVFGTALWIFIFIVACYALSYTWIALLEDVIIYGLVLAVFGFIHCVVLLEYIYVLVIENKGVGNVA